MMSICQWTMKMRNCQQTTMMRRYLMLQTTWLMDHIRKIIVTMLISFKYPSILLLTLSRSTKNPLRMSQIFLLLQQKKNIILLNMMTCNPLPRTSKPLEAITHADNIATVQGGLHVDPSPPLPPDINIDIAFHSAIVVPLGRSPILRMTNYLMRGKTYR